mmetsp:Transcript_52494/g.112259  ORF Transcript_52494/g.112259 Transcript_52494/m.112259 type:complete len:260 (-) Transcript_52494:506-1285(-)|eukprot:CAMPEP_0183358430 /NCGR_PEP_ID=MMETSP0164_2-20130417/49195_1 /TAXON_ID=221442 /ORGANISM="Coccolithus pelagicus ssp braarudi, Strain PLY182g" /LENGTH=259 /DNA_ID=CAMNT_0025532329 /DNA_START=14 /DNA_END=793 /DNA_ORIENTATION=-
MVRARLLHVVLLCVPAAALIHTPLALRVALPTSTYARAHMVAAVQESPHPRIAQPPLSVRVSLPLVARTRRAVISLLPRLLERVLGTLVCLAAAIISTSGQIALAATKKSAFGPGTGFLVGIAGGGGYLLYSYLEAEREDKEEEVRVKKEEERQKSLAKEFTDIEEGVATDEDLLDSLRKRVDNSSSTNGGADTGGDSGGPLPSSLESSGGGAATLDRPPEVSGEAPLPAEPLPAEPEPGASEADIERLKRMMGGPSEE